MTLTQLIAYWPSLVGIGSLIVFVMLCRPTPGEWHFIGVAVGLSLWAFFCVAIVAILTGCATSTRLKASVIDGKTVIEFYGAPDLVYARCGAGNANVDHSLISGCEWKRGIDSFIAYYDENPPEATIRHERAHAIGMQHGPWYRRGNALCADILVHAGSYTGKRICNVGPLGEWQEAP